LAERPTSIQPPSATSCSHHTSTVPAGVAIFCRPLVAMPMTRASPQLCGPRNSPVVASAVVSSLVVVTMRPVVVAPLEVVEVVTSVPEDRSRSVVPSVTFAVDVVPGSSPKAGLAAQPTTARSDASVRAGFIASR
jgi:hypothetical protein